MTDRFVARRRSTRLAALASAIVLATAAAYMVVYIARWEWTRALISASVLIAMLSIVSTVLVLSRIGELTDLVRASIAAPDAADRSLAPSTRPTDSTGASPAESATQQAPPPSPLAARAPGVDGATDTARALGAASRSHAARHFDWLKADGGAGVFIPVLLGAGMVLSAVAWLVERLSGALAGASLDRRIATEIPLDLPLGDRATRPVTVTRAPITRSRRVVTLGVVIAVLVLALGIELTRRATQANEAQNTGPGTSSIVLDVRSSSSRDPVTTTAVLWSVCAQQLDTAPAITAIASVGRFVAFSIDRSLGRTAKRRVMGCLEDFTLDRVVAKVVDLHTTPLPASSRDASTLPISRPARTCSSDGSRSWCPRVARAPTRPDGGTGHRTRPAAGA